MKHWLVGLSLVLGVFFMTPEPVAEARGFAWGRRSHNHSHHARGHSHHAPKVGHSSHSGGLGAPELDPNAAGGALVLLLGGLAYFMSRRREEDAA